MGWWVGRAGTRVCCTWQSSLSTMLLPQWGSAQPHMAILGALGSHSYKIPMGSCIQGFLRCFRRKKCEICVTQVRACVLQRPDILSHIKIKLIRDDGGLGQEGIKILKYLHSCPVDSTPRNPSFR